jgi:hypothetical protein
LLAPVTSAVLPEREIVNAMMNSLEGDHFIRPSAAVRRPEKILAGARKCATL